MNRDSRDTRGMMLPPKFERSPFPYFGGKRSVTADVWARLGSPKQYLEPFCGSAAMLLSAPSIASLEVIGDQNFYVANFWRALKFDAARVAAETDYPVSHVDLDARHAWLRDAARVQALRDSLRDPEWPGDARIAGWWVWGQCAWIGSGWCDPQSQIPHVSNAGRGVQSQIPHVSDAGRGIAEWFATLAKRLERVRVVHGDWTRCLNHHYGAERTAVFLDPPYRAYESLYTATPDAVPVADAVCEWARENAELRIALCGHAGDYDLPGWEQFAWSRDGNTYGGTATKDAEMIWFSPACERVVAAQGDLFHGCAT